MFIKVNGQFLLDKSGNPKSFKKQSQEDLEIMFPSATVEIVHEGGSSKKSIEKAKRLGITDKAEQEKYFAICDKLDSAKAELTALLKRNKCVYVVDNIPSKTVVGHDWYIQNPDKPDSKLADRIRKARKENGEIEEVEDTNEE